MLFFRAGKDGNMLLPVRRKSSPIKTPNILVKKNFSSHILEIYDEKGRDKFLTYGVKYGVLI